MEGEPHQLTLKLEPARTEEELRRDLERLFGRRFGDVVLTDNRNRILSAAPESNRSPKIRLRLHKSFVQADDALLALVKEFALGRLRGRERRQAIAAFRDHFDRHQPPERSARPVPRRTSLRPAGHVFDLEEIRDRICRLYFDGELGAGAPRSVPAITWGRAAPPARGRVRRRTLRLGSYDAKRHLVRIHPVLDHPEVPLFIVESIVHHELLHAVLPPAQPSSGSRRRIHHRRFRQREGEFALHEQAQEWLERSFDQLLRWRARPPRQPGKR